MENLNRRSFFKSVAIALASFGFLGKALAKGCENKPKGVKLVKDNKNAAKFKYVDVATDSKDPKYVAHVKKHTAANAICAKCKFYKTKKEKSNHAPCLMLGMSYVCADGWCNKYKFDKKKA